MHYTATNTGRILEALHRYNRFETRPPVTLPAGATFTDDAPRAVTLAKPFDPRIPPVKEAEAAA